MLKYVGVAAVPIEKQDNSAVLFADVSGSTKIYVTVGDDRAREIVARTLDGWSELTAHGGGAVIQLRGDGMLCMFPTVDAALRTAVAMRNLPYEPPLSMHAGIHAGPVLRESEQLYGDVVNVAARMADIAKRFEIVLTDAARQQLSPSPLWKNLRLIPKVPVKGKPEPMDIYLLPNDKQFLTDYRPPLTKDAGAVRLYVRYASMSVAIDAQSGTCLLGRDDECRVKVDHGLVSRRHASIECLSGKFFLQDHSTNGTYVTETPGGPVLVQRELCQLKGSGVISLGIEPRLNADHLISFSLDSRGLGYAPS